MPQALKALLFQLLESTVLSKPSVSIDSTTIKTAPLRRGKGRSQNGEEHGGRQQDGEERAQVCGDAIFYFYF